MGLSSTHLYHQPSALRLKIWLEKTFKNEYYQKKSLSLYLKLKDRCSRNPVSVTEKTSLSTGQGRLFSSVMRRVSTAPLLCLPRNCPLICHDPGQAEKCNYTTITISAMTKTPVKIPDRWFSNYQDISLEHLTTFITSHISSRCKYVTSHVSKY